jgi:hypothetical protein
VSRRDTGLVRLDPLRCERWDARRAVNPTPLASQVRFLSAAPLLVLPGGPGLGLLSRSRRFESGQGDHFTRLPTDAESGLRTLTC